MIGKVFNLMIKNDHNIMDVVHSNPYIYIYIIAKGKVKRWGWICILIVIGGLSLLGSIGTIIQSTQLGMATGWVR